MFKGGMIMLKKIRIVIATICFISITLLFLDFTGTVHLWLSWLAKIQFFPAILAANFIIVGIFILLTILFGRVYCSTLCPLGVFQDAVSWIASKKKKNRFSYSSTIDPLRYIILGIFVVSIIIDIYSLTSLLEPYSAYGRIASNIFEPIYLWGNNLLAYLAERMNSYAFYSVDVWIKSVSTFTIALLTFLLLIVLSWKKGRLYCNTICPIGTVLGLFSRFALCKPRINEENCIHCGLCEKNCKASCIDAKSETIDYSRCISCFNCIDVCPQGGIQYTISGLKKIEEENKILDGKSASRRKFFTIFSLFALGFIKKAYGQDFDGGLAIIEDKKEPERLTEIVPPGAFTIQHLRKNCTGCQLCITACPNQILMPSNDLLTLMQPEISYKRGYCRPECTKCSEVCPTSAINKVTVAEKSSIQIGHAVWNKDLCLVNKDKVKCDNCARHCPTGAINMELLDSNNPLSLKIPIINESRCIGCGACEHLCPSRPYSAIYIEGHERHKTI